MFIPTATPRNCRPTCCSIIGRHGTRLIPIPSSSVAKRPLLGPGRNCHKVRSVHNGPLPLGLSLDGPTQIGTLP